MKANLVKDINKYLDQNREDQKAVDSVVEFIGQNENFLTRDNLKGHLTGSCWIMNGDLSKVFLIHHKKYDMWLQPGGHIEADETPLEASMREGLEETGIQDLELLTPYIFDIDVHTIPASEKKGEPEHTHFDVRFILKTKSGDSSINLEECNGFQWVGLDELQGLTDSPSTLRMIEKTKRLVEQLKSENKPRVRARP